MAVITKIENAHRLLNCEKGKIALDYLREAYEAGSAVNTRIMNRPLGAFERVNLTDGIFALEQVFYTKDRSTCFFESHRKYADFQLIISGREQMELTDISKLSVKEPYDEQKDLIIYQMTDSTSKILMERGDLSLYLPEDAHMGLPFFGKPELVYKTVIKFPVEYLNV